jgi:hypothetical protein
VPNNPAALILLATLSAVSTPISTLDKREYPINFTSQYHFPLETNILPLEIAPSSLLVDITVFVLPSEKVGNVVDDKGLRVQKLLVGVSVVWSMLVKLLTVKLFPSPEVSVPKAPLSWNSKKNPFVPYVPE